MKQLKNYPPKLFHSNQIKDAFKIASATKFSSMILPKHPQKNVVFNPFYNMFEQTGKKEFYGHMAKNNPIYEILSKSQKQDCQLIFNAADVYISPSCYREKELTHNVVPTWNYVTAQFRGTIQIVGKDQLYGLLTKEVELFESEAGSEWRLSDSSPEYVQKLVKSIFGVRIQVDQWMAQMKLSQNKTHQRQNIQNWTRKQQARRKTCLDWMQDFK